MSGDVGREERCGYAVVDDEGQQEPCDRPATGWRWYQDVEHEDALEVACIWHENEGGRRMRAAEQAMSDLDAARVAADLRDQVARLRAERDEARAAVARVEALADELDAWDGQASRGDDVRDALRAPESPADSGTRNPASEPPQAVHGPLRGRDGAAEGEATIQVTAVGMTEPQVEALFDRVAEAAHALDEPVFCIGSAPTSEQGERRIERGGR